MDRPVLSKRMEAVMELVPEDASVVCDVGCDHAYISIRLITDHIADKVIAMDVRKGPLDIAINNINNYGLEKTIETRLSDGLEKLLPMEADVIIIAGMGGILIKNILTSGCNILHSKKPPILILQPQSDIDKVRHFLYEDSYHIVKENMVFEDGKYYTVILAYPGKMSPYDMEEEYIYGRYNIENSNPVLMSYLKKEYDMYYDILSKLNANLQTESSKTEKNNVDIRTKKRIEEIKEKLKNNKAAYERCIKTMVRSKRG